MRAHFIKKGEFVPEFRIYVRIRLVTAGGHVEIMQDDLVFQAGAYPNTIEMCRQSVLPQKLDIDGDGRKAAFTGSATKDFKGHRFGKDFIAVGNVLAGEPVLVAMSEGFQATSGELADKLLAADVWQATRRVESLEVRIHLF